MHLFQVGVGSGGVIVLDVLARDPRIKRISLIEPDHYSERNVYRHLFPSSAISRLKVEIAAEWVKDRRPDLTVDVVPADLTDPAYQEDFRQLAKDCDIGICAVDNETAKYAFDSLMRENHKPWTLGEVLSGGIGGWAHQFLPGQACYGCVASHLQRNIAESPQSTPPDYSDPGAAVAETRIPASKAAIEAIASLHALRTLELIDADAVHQDAITSILFTLARVPGVFDDPYRTYKFRIPRSAACLICRQEPGGREDLDEALDQALARLVKE